MLREILLDTVCPHCGYSPQGEDSIAFERVVIHELPHAIDWTIQCLRCGKEFILSVMGDGEYEAGSDSLCA